MVEAQTNAKLVAHTVEGHEEVEAKYVTKEDGPFYCPDTFEELIVRKCAEKVDHFAYKGRKSPTASKESELHKACKAELLALLEAKYPNGKWKAERHFEAKPQKDYAELQADLSGRIGEADGTPVIIEIQKSSVSLELIKHRTKEYNKRTAYILWIIPLTKELGEENFRPRLFERFLHTMYYGRVYYWHEGDGSILTPVHFDTAYRWIEESTWYDEHGEEQTAGGYDKAFTRTKKPLYGSPVDLLIDFTTKNRNKFDSDNEKLSAPESKIYLDNKMAWWDTSKEKFQKERYSESMNIIEVEVNKD